MARDELLAQLNDLPEVIGLSQFKSRHDALRAVVELHRASKVEGRWGKVRLCCLRCQTNYPCQTIQAIEEKLK